MQKLVNRIIATLSVVCFPLVIYMSLTMPVSEDYDRGAIGFGLCACHLFTFFANMWANEEDYEHPFANSALGLLLVTQAILWFHFGPWMFVSN